MKESGKKLEGKNHGDSLAAGLQSPGELREKRRNILVFEKHKNTL